MVLKQIRLYFNRNKNLLLSSRALPYKHTSDWFIHDSWVLRIMFVRLSDRHQCTVNLRSSSPCTADLLISIHTLPDLAIASDFQECPQLISVAVRLEIQMPFVATNYCRPRWHVGSTILKIEDISGQLLVSQEGKTSRTHFFCKFTRCNRGAVTFLVCTEYPSRSFMRRLIYQLKAHSELVNVTLVRHLKTADWACYLSFVKYY